MEVRLLLSDRDDADASATLLEVDRAGDQSEQTIVLGALDVTAGVELRSALTEDDAAGRDQLAAVGFDTEALRLGIATVASRALTLLMCHDAETPTKNPAK
jgi:hypothetical protein